MPRDLRKRGHWSIAAKSLPPQQQTVYLHHESKGRGGKTVTLVKNLILAEADLRSLAKRLKQACGSVVKDIVSGDRLSKPNGR
jgi:translation initiation factor 1